MIFGNKVGIAELVRAIPEGGCLLVFNVKHLGSWRTSCTREGLSCFAGRDDRTHTHDLYITRRSRHATRTVHIS